MTDSADSSPGISNIADAPPQVPPRPLSPAEEAAAILAHELRGPLSVVLGYLGILERSPDEEVRSHAIGAARRAVERMDSLIDDVLRSINPGSACEPELLQRISVREFVSGMVADLPPSDVDVEVLAEDDGLVVASELQLARAFGNVLCNALKFSPSGSTVRIVVRTQLDRVLITVEDEGPGVPPEECDRVFGRFERLPRDSDVPGFGLGLGITRDIIATAGGTVRIRSRDDAAGTCVAIDLPCAPDPS